MVSGVKGNNESSYRNGNVNLTCDNIGAASSTHTHPINTYYNAGSIARFTTTTGKESIKSFTVNSIGVPYCTLLVFRVWYENGDGTFMDGGRRLKITNENGDTFYFQHTATYSGGTYFHGACIIPGSSTSSTTIKFNYYQTSGHTNYVNTYYRYFQIPYRT